MLLDPSVISLVVERTREDDFYIPAYREMRNEIIALWEASKKCDLITLTQSLRDKGKLDAIGGASAVTSAFTFITSSALITDYIRILLSKSAQRQFISVISEAEKLAWQDCDDPIQLLTETQFKIASIKREEKKRKTTAEHVSDKIERMEKGEPDEDIVVTRLIELDKICPIRAGSMPVIKAATKQGKTTLGLSIVENICISEGRPGLIFSLEDRIPVIIDRIFAGVSRIPLDRHHVKKMTEHEITRATKAAEKIAAANILIYDDVFDLLPMIAVAKQAIVKFPDLAVIMVDYLQLVRTVSKKSDTREREVASISRAWRLFAMETGVPVILISQENAQGDTRESKAIEQDATAIIKVSLDGEDASVIVERQRSGPSPRGFRLRFLGNLSRMENPAKETA